MSMFPQNGIVRMSARYGTHEEDAMVRYGLIGFVAGIVVAASLVPGDAFAVGRGGGGRGAAGFHGGARMAGGPRPSHPIAGRPGRPVAGRPGYPGRGYAYRGAAYGAAAGAAAAGLYGSYNNYNNNGCYQDANGRWICPGQSPYNPY
jgi:hypothetical protein